MRLRNITGSEEVIANSDLLVHVESFEKFYTRDLKYAFSTKIADSLASGIPLFMYGAEQISCTRYLKNNNCV